MVASHIEIKLIGYHVSFDGCLLRTDEIVRFLGELEALYNSLSGIAELRTMEGTIYLRAAVDTLGHIHWEGHTIYPPWNGNSLSFRFTSDQTFLPDLIQGLTDTMKALHMIGKRP